MSCQRGGLGGYAFHQIAVADNGVGMIIDDFVAGPVEHCCQIFFRNGHTYTSGESLAERSGGRFYAAVRTVFGMAGGLALPLSEVLYVIERYVMAREVQQTVKEHGAVS